jgi:hypothetical protein
MSEPRRRLLFVKKKKQKDFFKLGHAGFNAAGPAQTKVFCAAFLQKSGRLPVSSSPISLWRFF